MKSLTRDCVFVMAAILLGIFSAHAQPIADEMLKVQKTFATEKLSFEMNYRIYTSAGSPISNQHQSFNRSGQFYHYRMLDQEVLQNSNLLIRVDHRLKTIHLHNPQTITDALTNQQMLMALNLCDSSVVTYQGSIMELKCCIKQSTHGANERLKIAIDTSNHTIVRIELNSKNAYTNSNSDDNNKLIIDYLNYNFNPTFTEDEFSSSMIVTESDGNYRGFGIYKNYEIISEIAEQ